MVSSTWRYPRRAFLSWCAGLLAMGPRRALPGSGSISASPSREQGYRILSTPVVVPAETISEPWSSVPFVARVPKGDPTAGAVSLDGILIRLGPGHAPAIQAFCLLCPHEICHVQYRTDTSQVQLDAGATYDHPLLVCPCHFSVFDPSDTGALVSGPAYRGLYRFKIQVDAPEDAGSDGGETVRITQVEEEVLTLLEAVGPTPDAPAAFDAVRPSREER